MLSTVVAFSKFHLWSPFQKEHYYLASEDFTEPPEPLIERASLFINKEDKRRFSSDLYVKPVESIIQNK
jgi:hypothetical protein